MMGGSRTASTDGLGAEMTRPAAGNAPFNIYPFSGHSGAKTADTTSDEPLDG